MFPAPRKLEKETSTYICTGIYTQIRRSGGVDALERRHCLASSTRAGGKLLLTSEFENGSRDRESAFKLLQQVKDYSKYRRVERQGVYRLFMAGADR